MPIAFVVIVVVAFAADFWLYRTAGGLAARATGLDEQAADRRGVRVGLLFMRAFFITAFAAAMGGFFLAAQVGIGDPRIGSSYTLTSIAAAVLGGASLFGGRGSFIGAVVGALFLNVVINVLPFLGWSASYGRIMVGALTLVALALYQAPELLARFRMFVANFRLSRRGPPPPTRPDASMAPLDRLLACQGDRRRDRPLLHAVRRSGLGRPYRALDRRCRVRRRGRRLRGPRRAAWSSSARACPRATRAST